MVFEERGDNYTCEVVKLLMIRVYPFHFWRSIGPFTLAAPQMMKRKSRTDAGYAEAEALTLSGGRGTDMGTTHVSRVWFPIMVQ